MTLSYPKYCLDQIEQVVEISNFKRTLQNMIKEKKIEIIAPSLGLNLGKNWKGMILRLS